jgi:antitoxin ParD1/3/4
MPSKDTLNVSLTPEIAAFVEGLVSGGQYRSASEVVRTALRLLERAERERLLQKWLLEGELSPEESARLPEGARERFRQLLRWKVEDGLDSLRKGEGVPGDEVFAKWERRLRALEQAEQERKTA